MNLADKRAGGIDKCHLPPLGFGGNRFGNAVRGKDDRGVIWYLAELFNENRAFRLQPLDHVTIVHDLVAHIYWSTMFFEAFLDNLDRSVDAGTEASWRGEAYGKSW